MNEISIKIYPKKNSKTKSDDFYLPYWHPFLFVCWGLWIEVSKLVYYCGVSTMSTIHVLIQHSKIWNTKNKYIECVIDSIMIPFRYDVSLYLFDIWCIMIPFRYITSWYIFNTLHHDTFMIHYIMIHFQYMMDTLHKDTFSIHDVSWYLSIHDVS